MTDSDPFAKALADLRPAAPGVNLPALMYRAGQASRDRAVAGWRAAFAASLVGLGGTWAAVFAFPERLPVAREQVVPPTPFADPTMDGSNLEQIGRAVVGGPRSPTVRPPAPVVEVPEPSMGPSEYVEYLRVRDDVLANGLAGLPPAPPPPGRMSAAEVGRWVGVH